MTALLPRPDTTTWPTWTIGAPRLLAGLDTHPRLDARTHLATHGPLPGTDLGHLLAHLDAVALVGRGGAAFPVAAKIRALRGRRRQLIVNGTESEPASHKDRILLTRTPHLVLDGALAVAGAVGAGQVTIAVHDAATAAAVQEATAQRGDAARVEVRRIEGGFVAGEARAVVRALGGGPALPTGRRTPPTEQGVLIGNAETFAQVALLLRLGPRRFAETGTRGEPGTTLLSVSGAVARPGVVEIPLGTPLGLVLSAAQATAPVAVVTGGYHGSWLAPRPDVLLSRAGLAAAGATLGAGVLLALDASTCGLGELARVAAWLAGESAGQCGPCRFGLPALAADVHALYRGDVNGFSMTFEHGRMVSGRGACAHPDGTVGFITSGLQLLRDDIDRHLHGGGCGRSVLGQLPVGTSR